LSFFSHFASFNLVLTNLLYCSLILFLSVSSVHSIFQKQNFHWTFLGFLSSAQSLYTVTYFFEHISCPYFKILFGFPMDLSLFSLVFLLIFSSCVSGMTGNLTECQKLYMKRFKDNLSLLIILSSYREDRIILYVKRFKDNLRLLVILISCKTNKLLLLAYRQSGHMKVTLICHVLDWFKVFFNNSDRCCKSSFLNPRI
jgi:hypothetical protein